MLKLNLSELPDSIVNTMKYLVDSDYVAEVRLKNVSTEDNRQVFLSKRHGCRLTLNSNELGFEVTSDFTVNVDNNTLQITSYDTNEDDDLDVTTLDDRDLENYYEAFVSIFEGF